MAKEKPLTLRDLKEYHKKTLAPLLREDFATKKEIEYLIDIVVTKEELIGVEKRLGVKMDNIGKDVKEIKTKLTEAGVLQ